MKPALYTLGGLLIVAAYVFWLRAGSCHWEMIDAINDAATKESEKIPWMMNNHRAFEINRRYTDLHPGTRLPRKMYTFGLLGVACFFGGVVTLVFTSGLR